MSWETYLEMFKIKEEYEQDLPYFIDFVDLGRADKNFLSSCSKQLTLLKGQKADYDRLLSAVQENNSGE